MDWSRSKFPAMNVVIDPTTAPSMMPTRGTMIDDLIAIRRSTTMNTIVPPANAKTTETTIFVRGAAFGIRISVNNSPRPAHWAVPAVVGSTNLFCVMSCMITPATLIATAAKISASVRGHPGDEEHLPGGGIVDQRPEGDVVLADHQ